MYSCSLFRNNISQKLSHNRKDTLPRVLSVNTLIASLLNYIFFFVSNYFMKLCSKIIIITC